MIQMERASRRYDSPIALIVVILFILAMLAAVGFAHPTIASTIRNFVSIS